MSFLFDVFDKQVRLCFFSECFYPLDTGTYNKPTNVRFIAECCWILHTMECFFFFGWPIRFGCLQSSVFLSCQLTFFCRNFQHLLVQLFGLFSCSMTFAIPYRYLFFIILYFSLATVSWPSYLTFHHIMSTLYLYLFLLCSVYLWTKDTVSLFFVP